MSPAPRPCQESTSPYAGHQPAQRGCVRRVLCTAEARTTEEPEAGKLHVRDCTGGPGNRHSYRRALPTGLLGAPSLRSASSILWASSSDNCSSSAITLDRI
jgi:hypothetical protein